MDSSNRPVTNHASSETDLDTLMMSKDDIEIYGGKEDEQQNEMNIDGELEKTNEKVSPRILYSGRWWILISMVLLNFGSRGHLTALASVTNNCSKYYDQTGERIMMIFTISAFTNAVSWLICSYVIEAVGLKTSLRFGGIMTFVGGGLCCISSFPYVWNETLPKGNAQFSILVLGTAISSAGFVSTVGGASKASQHWFGENERALSTALMTLSQILGQAIGIGLTPFMIPKYENITRLNIVWFIPVLLGFIICLSKVNSDYPPTPPSVSAEVEIKLNLQRLEKSSKVKIYWNDVKEQAKNRQFLMLILSMGSLLAVGNTFLYKMDQFLCARGYSDKMSGLAASTLIMSGLIGAIPIGILVRKLNKNVEIVKICTLVAFVAICMVSYVITLYDQYPLIITLNIIFGIFTLGTAPTTIELLAECTYPINQATGFCLFNFLLFLQNAFMLACDNFLSQPLSQDEMMYQNCAEKGDSSHVEAKNYLPYAYFMVAWVGFCGFFFMIWFNPELKRLNVDKGGLLQKKVHDGDEKDFSNESERLMLDELQNDGQKKKEFEKD